MEVDTPADDNMLIDDEIDVIQSNHDNINIQHDFLDSFAKAIDNNNSDNIRDIMKWLIDNFFNIKKLEWFHLIKKFVNNKKVFQLAVFNIKDFLVLLRYFKYYSYNQYVCDSLIEQTFQEIWKDLNENYSNMPIYAEYYSELFSATIDLGYSESGISVIFKEIINLDFLLKNVQIHLDFENKHLAEIAKNLVLISESSLVQQLISDMISKVLAKLTQTTKFRSDISDDEKTSILFILKEMIKYGSTSCPAPITCLKSLIQKTNLIDNILIYLSNNAKVVNFIFSKVFKFASSIISNTFYYYADNDLKGQIFEKFYNEIKLNSITVKFEPIFQSFIYKEYIDNKKEIKPSSNNSFDFAASFVFLNKFSTCYMYLKLIYDCINGQKAHRNAQNISSTHNYLTLENDKFLKEIHTNLLYTMIACIIDNSHFIKLFSKKPTKLDNTFNSCSSYGSSKSEILLEKVTNINSIYIINQLEDQSETSVLNGNFTQFLVNLTFELPKVIIKYFDRLSYSIFFDEAIKNNSISIKIFVSQNLDTRGLKELKDHEGVIKFLISILLLLGETSFIKENISVGFTYFIADELEQTILGTIHDYILSILQDKNIAKSAFTSIEAVDQNVALFLKLVFSWLKFLSKILNSKKKLFDLQYLLIESLSKKLIISIVEKINNNIIAQNIDFKMLIHNLIIKLKLDKKYLNVIDGVYAINPNNIMINLHAFNSISKENEKFSEYIEPTIDHPLARGHGDNDGMRTIKRKLLDYIKQSAHSKDLKYSKDSQDSEYDDYNDLCILINSIVKRANKIKIYFYYFINLHIIRLMEQNKDIDFNLSENAIKDMIRNNITIISYKNGNISKRKSETRELNASFEIFANAISNNFVESSNMEEVIASCAKEISKNCYNHLKRSFNVYFRLFLKLQEFDKDQIKQIMSYNYYQGDDLDIRKYNRLFLNSSNFKTYTFDLNLRIKLFYCVLKFIIGIHTDKKTENNARASKSSLYNYKYDVNTQYEYEINKIENVKKRAEYKSKNIPKAINFSEYKRENPKKQTFHKPIMKTQTMRYTQYNPNDDADMLDKTENLVMFMDRGNNNNNDSDKEDNDNDEESERKLAKLMSMNKTFIETKYIETSFLKTKTFTLFPTAELRLKYIQFDLTAIVNLLNHFNLKNKVYDTFDYFNKHLTEMKSSVSPSLTRAKEIGKLNLFNKFFENESLLRANNMLDYTARSFYTDGNGVSVNFKKNIYDNPANNTTRSEEISDRPVEIKKTGNLIAIDPGITSILEGIEEIGTDNYERITKTCNDYYSKRLINSANIHRVLDLDKEEFVHIKNIFKTMPTLKTINSIELATNIGYNFFFIYRIIYFL